MADSNDSWNYYRNIVKDEIFPCLLLDLDLFSENISAVAKRLESNSSTKKTIRVASKSVRSIKLL